jgi:toxin ParE1/3/4
VPDVFYLARIERDLEEVGDFIALDNPRAAVEFIEAIRRHCSLFAGTPLLGRARPEIHPAVRSFPHGRYVVYYRFDPVRDRIEILRLWHARRRFPTQRMLGIRD